MTISRFLLIFICFVGGSIISNLYGLCSQEDYIKTACQEWDKQYVQQLDPYQLQLLASNLNLLRNQAMHTIHVETLKQQIIWKVREVIDRNIRFLEQIPTDCAQYTQLKSRLDAVESALLSCNQCTKELDSAYAQPLQEALEIVQIIGREALTYHNDDIETKTNTLIYTIKKALDEFALHNTTLKDVADMIKTEQEYKQLIQFYTLQSLNTNITHNAWNIIALNIAQTMDHLELLKTCFLVFDACFTLTKQNLEAHEAPAEYHTLLFVPEN